MTTSGKELEKLQKMYRLTPAEVAAEAGISTSTLQRSYRDEAPVETRLSVAKAIEQCRKRLPSNQSVKQLVS